MVDDERSNLAGLRRKAAEKTPYPYFLERLEDIEAWLKAGFSVRSVWRIYSDKSVPFPGSYRSFLRYCQEHCESASAPRRKAPNAPEATPGRAVSVLGQGKRYPPPRTRPPGLTPEQIDRMMDPDRDLDPKRWWSATSGSLSCFRRSRWQCGLTSARTPCGNGYLATIVRVYVRGVRFGFGRTR